MTTAALTPIATEPVTVRLRPRAVVVGGLNRLPGGPAQGEVRGVPAGRHRDPSSRLSIVLVAALVLSKPPGALLVGSRGVFTVLCLIRSVRGERMPATARLRAGRRESAWRLILDLVE